MTANPSSPRHAATSVADSMPSSASPMRSIHAAGDRATRSPNTAPTIATVVDRDLLAGGEHAVVLRQSPVVTVAEVEGRERGEPAHHIADRERQRRDLEQGRHARDARRRQRDAAVRAGDRGAQRDRRRAPAGAQRKEHDRRALVAGDDGPHDRVARLARRARQRVVMSGPARSTRGCAGPVAHERHERAHGGTATGGRTSRGRRRERGCRRRSAWRARSGCGRRDRRARGRASCARRRRAAGRRARSRRGQQHALRAAQEQSARREQIGAVRHAHDLASGRRHRRR